MDLSDRDRIGEPSDLWLPIAGNQKDPRKPVLRSQMTDEPAAVGARDVVEAEARRVLVIQNDDALQTRGLARWQFEPPAQHANGW